MKARFFLSNRSEAGFTLMEILITLSLATVLFAGFYGVLTAYSRQIKQSAQYYRTHHSAHYAQAVLARDLNEAVRVETQRGGNQTGDALLILALPSVDAAGDPVNIQATFDYVTYRLDPAAPTDLLRQVEVNPASARNGGQDSDRVVAEGVTELLFSSDGDGLSSVGDVTALDSVRVRLTSRQSVIDAAQISNVDNEFVLRNHG